MKCNYCGKEFEPSKYQLGQIKKGKIVYCSKGCGTSARYDKGIIIDDKFIDKIKNEVYNTNKSIDQIQKESGLTEAKFKSFCGLYNIQRTKEHINSMRRESIVRTTQEKYGVDNVMDLEEFRDKIIETKVERYGTVSYNNDEKHKQTCLEKYGSETYNNRESAAKTNLEKYGVKFPVEMERVKEARLQGSIKKYGVENPLSSKEVHSLAKQAMKEKYGFEYGFQLLSIRNKSKETMKNKYNVENAMYSDRLKQKMIDTMLERYGVEYGCMTEQCREATPLTISKLNKEWASKLKEILDEDIIFEKKINLFSYDLCIDDKLLIDINPTVSHNSTYDFMYMVGKSTENKSPIKPDYHYRRVLNALENGYELISIFDWMDTDKVIDIIKARLKKLNNRIFGNKCKVLEISQRDANIFLNQYHLQGGTNGQEVCVGLFYNEELVQVQTFGKPRFNKDVEWEAIRLASKEDTYIIGGVSKGFKYFVNKYNPKSIISYNSLNISSGHTDDMQGFKLQGYSKSQGIWVNTILNDNPYIVRDMSLRKQGIDRILGRPAEDFPDYDGTFETSNEYLMIQEGYVKVYDCGNITYIWNKE